MPEQKLDQTAMKKVTCSFCAGTGRDQFGIMSWVSKCCVCGGKGVVDIQVPYTRCAHCNGTGAVKTFVCTTCMGKGVVPLPPSPITVCLDCRGSGDDASAPGMACLKCRGRGFITAP